MQCFLDDVGVEAVQRDAGVVDDKVDALCVRVFEVLRQGGDARLVCDVEVVVFDFCEAAVGFERFCLLELCILLELRDRGFASAFVARCEVDQEGSVV
jgi:hypothetical protein